MQMATEQHDVEPRTDDHHKVLDEPEEREATEKPEITDEHREKAKEIFKATNEDRPTVKLPGSDGAVAGTAVNDWIDEDGNPKYSDTSKDEGSDAKKAEAQ
jgi:hypothetical protein